jgi:hypothetical protein
MPLPPTHKCTYINPFHLPPFPTHHTRTHTHTHTHTPHTSKGTPLVSEDQNWWEGRGRWEKCCSGELLMRCQSCSRGGVHGAGGGGGVGWDGGQKGQRLDFVSYSNSILISNPNFQVGGPRHLTKPFSHQYPLPQSFQTHPPPPPTIPAHAPSLNLLRTSFKPPRPRLPPVHPRPPCS